MRSGSGTWDPTEGRKPNSAGSPGICGDRCLGCLELPPLLPGCLAGREDPPLHPGGGRDSLRSPGRADLGASVPDPGLSCRLPDQLSPGFGAPDLGGVETAIGQAKGEVS